MATDRKRVRSIDVCGRRIDGVDGELGPDGEIELFGCTGLESAARMVTGTPEPAVGVPEMAPLAESKVSPMGNWPEVIVHVRGPEAPWACKVRLKGTVWTHCTLALVVMVMTSGGGGGGVLKLEPPPHPAVAARTANAVNASGDGARRFTRPSPETKSRAGSA